MGSISSVRSYAKLMTELLGLMQPLLGAGADLAMIVFLYVAWKLDRRIVRIEALLMNGKSKDVE